jgi:hypothetical protein
MAIKNIEERQRTCRLHSNPPIQLQSANVYLHFKEILIYVFPENELRGLCSNFHIHVSVSDSYTVFSRSVHLFPAAEYARSWEYINRRQEHECRNWDRGRAVPFLGIYVSNFRYSIFAVCEFCERIKISKPKALLEFFTVFP